MFVAGKVEVQGSLCYATRATVAVARAQTAASELVQAHLRIDQCPHDRIHHLGLSVLNVVEKKLESARKGGFGTKDRLRYLALIVGWKDGCIL